MRCNRLVFRKINVLVFITAAMLLCVSCCQASYTLTIYVRLGDGSMDFGHTFVGVNDGQHEIIRGFYPAEGASLPGKVFGTKAEVRDDASVVWGVAKTYDISSEQYQQALGEINKWSLEIPEYAATDRHCGDFAEAVAKKAGLDVGLIDTITGRNRPKLFAEALLRAGRIKFRYRNGGAYEGQVSNGHAEGSGRYKFPDGSEYVGEFKNDGFCGKGELNVPGRGVMSGTWTSLGLHGMGKVVLQDKTVYEGNYICGVSTVGHFSYPNGDSFQGQHSDGLLIYGKYKFANGDRYEGEFINGAMNQFGAYTYKNGAVLRGSYQGKTLHGSFSINMPNGDIYFGQAVNGKFVGMGNKVVKGQFQPFNFDRNSPFSPPSTPAQSPGRSGGASAAGGSRQGIGSARQARDFDDLTGTVTDRSGTTSIRGMEITPREKTKDASEHELADHQPLL